MHQPFGLISPATTLQLVGGTNCTHPLQRWAPFGWSWYCTVDFVAFACAPAGRAAASMSQVSFLKAPRREGMSRSFSMLQETVAGAPALLAYDHQVDRRRDAGHLALGQIALRALRRIALRHGPVAG